MAQIQSGATSDLMTVDPVSKAARVTLYDDKGNPINPNKSDKFLLPINIGVTAVIAAASIIWAIRNGATKTMNIERILLNCGFFGTAAGSAQAFDLVRFNSATPTGGTAGPSGASVPRKDTAGVASTLVDYRAGPSGALTTTGMVFDPSQIVTVGVVRSVTGNSFGYMMDDLDFNLAPNEGLALRLSNPTVVGDFVSGYVQWTEK